MPSHTPIAPALMVLILFFHLRYSLPPLNHASPQAKMQSFSSRSPSSWFLFQRYSLSFNFQAVKPTQDFRHFPSRTFVLTHNSDPDRITSYPPPGCQTIPRQLSVMPDASCCSNPLLICSSAPRFITPANLATVLHNVPFPPPSVRVYFGLMW